MIPSPSPCLSLQALNEMDGCTFAPAINMKSRETVQRSGSGSVPVVERLYRVKQNQVGAGGQGTVETCLLWRRSV